MSTTTAYAQRAAEEASLRGEPQTAMVEAVVIGAALASRLDGAPTATSRTTLLPYRWALPATRPPVTWAPLTR